MMARDRLLEALQRCRRGRGRPRRFDQAAILAAYVSGDKIEAIAAQYGVSPPYPGMLAKRRGVPPRGKGRLT
jgi:hypothetical protein